MRTVRSMGVVTFILAAIASRSQLPPLKHEPWDARTREAIARIDRRLIRDGGDQYRPLTDNRDRVHLTVRFNSTGGRMTQVAVPEAWGDERAAAVSVECARHLGWPVSARYIARADGSLVATVTAPAVHRASWNEDVPWPDLVQLLQVGGARRVEIRLRCSGLPLESAGGWRGWNDAGNAIMENRLYLCESDAPPPPSHLRVGFGPGFAASRIVAALLTFAAGVGMLLVVYRAALRAVGRGRPAAKAARWLRTTSFAFFAVWVFEVVLYGTTYLTTLVPVAPSVGFYLRLVLLIGPPATLALASALLGQKIRRCERASLPGPDLVFRFRFLAVLVILCIGAGFAIVSMGRANNVGVFRRMDSISHWIVPVVIVINLLARLLTRSIKGIRKKIAKGELAERAARLAASAGVPLAEVQVIDAPILRANGLVSLDGRIRLTRAALSALTKPEIDALIAHELAHLQLGHLPIRARTVMLQVLPGASLLAWSILSGSMPALIAGLLAVPLSWVVAAPALRRQEFAADARAVEILGDSRVVISTLARICAENRQKLDGSWFERVIGTHPSTLARIRAIGSASGIPPSDVNSIIDQARGKLSVSAQLNTENCYDWQTMDLAPLSESSSAAPTFVI